MGQDQKTTLLLTGGIDDRSEREFIAPVVQSGTAPTLANSINTRLSVLRGTCVRAPDFEDIETIDDSPPCYGLVPALAGQSAMAFFSAKHDRNRRLRFPDEGGAEGEQFRPSSSFDAVYRPVRVADAGALAFRPGPSHVATAYDATTGMLWHASYVQAGGTVAGILATSWNLQVYATDGAGMTYLAPQTIAQVPNVSQPWIGLTTHGANGVCVWFLDPTGANGPGLCKIRVVYTGSGTWTVGSANVVYVPATYLSALDVVRYDDTQAVIVGPDAATGDDGIVMVYQVMTNTAVDTETLTGAMDTDGSQASVSVDVVNGTTYIAAAFASVGTTDVNVQLYTFAASALTAIWGSPYTWADYGHLAVKFLDNGTVGQAGVAVAMGHFEGSFQGLSGDIYTEIRTIDLLGGTLREDWQIPWRILANHGAQVRVSSTELYPLFFLVPCYGDDAASPLSLDFVDQPVIEGHMVMSVFDAFAVRVLTAGCVRGTVAPARVIYDQFLMTTACETTSFRVLMAYRKDNFETVVSSLRGYVSRWVEFDFDEQQPNMVHDRDGAALVAAAHPFVWDGVHVTPIGHAIDGPKINAVPTGGTGDSLAAGVYSFKAIYKWIDATGLEHRSRPSNTVTLTLGGADEPIVYVTNPIPDQQWSILLYMTEMNGASFHLVTDLADPATSTPFYDVYNDISTPNGANAQLYSLTGAGGEELFPYPPPPLHDIAIVGSRAWGLDAEIKSRAVFSKLRIAGIGYEWAPALEVPFPSGAGDLQAVREWQGLPVFMAERACFQVSGNGPNNTGGGDSYGAPVKVSDIGCTNANSVIYTPAGIMWQYNDFFALLNAQGVQTFPNIRADEPVSRAVLMRDQDEVVFFTEPNPENNGRAWVYNYAVQRWTTWTGPAVKQAVNIPSDTQRSITYAPDDGIIHLIEHTSECARLVTWETDWFLLGGDFQDPIVVRWIVFTGRSDANSDFTAEFYANYVNAPATDGTWTAAEMATIVDADGRFTVKLEPTEQSTRGMKLRFTDSIVEDSGGTGVKPVSVTIVWMLEDELIREETFELSATTIK